MVIDNQLHSYLYTLFLFESVRLPAGETFKEIGDSEDNLFFIVSGQLEDSMYLTLQNQGKVFRKPTLILSKNDYFGEIYPFDKEQQSQSYVETLQPTELVSISKEKLIKICRKYPNIELAIIDLLKIRSQLVTSEPSVKLRGAPRYDLDLALNNT
jgi:CRP-like cAMP-binding protein